MDFIDLKTQYRRLKPAIDAGIQAVLDHGQYIMGPEVAELEQRLAAYVGVEHAVGISDGTTALQVAMMALDIGPGDEIITTPFTFIATGETIALLGAKPVFVDIDPVSFNLDPALIEAAITPRTRAILPVSLYGQCADLDAINAIAARHGLPVIEDGAQSFGATRRGRRSCGLSTIGTTSFFPSKPLGCYGDGGACFTDDDALAKRMREIRVHGQDRRYHHPVVGLNGRLDTIQAAVLLAKLPVFDDEVQARERIGAALSARIRERVGDAVAPPAIGPENTSVYAQYTVRLHEPLDRAQVAERLKAAGIPTAVHYPIPLHRQPAMARVAVVPAPLPVAERAAGEVISLPMHPYLDDTQLDRIADALAAAVTAR
ncbi:MAG: DegT/DnrJ/EryC1/StrS family aminotransferase [Burkholderiaceae bacterium]